MGASPAKHALVDIKTKKIFKKNYKSEKWKILIFEFRLKNYKDCSNISPGGAGNGFRAQKTDLKFFDFRT